MTEDDAYRLAESFSSEVSPTDRYAFGRALMGKLESYAAGCLVAFGDESKAIACIADGGTVSFLTFDEPVIQETFYGPLDGSVRAHRSRLLSAPSAFLEDSTIVVHPAFPGGSVTIDAIPPPDTSTEGAGEALLGALFEG
jgi:hypothetical protein